jgi:hypothetical protein
VQTGAAYFGQDLPEPVDDALLVLLNHLERARGRDYPEYDQDHDDSNNCTHRDHLSFLDPSVVTKEPIPATPGEP